jgi:adenosylcobinamide-phosphate synthase
MLATLLALALGFLLDQWLGDPPDWPHPVRALGWLVRRLEPLLRPWLPERLAGILLWLLVVGTAAGTVWALLLLCDWLHRALRLAAEVVLIYGGSLAGR